MRIIRDYKQCPEAFRGCVVALGNFDGVHDGHAAIMRQAVSLAHDLHVPAAVMTFCPHPREFFSPDAPRLRLMNFRQKMQAFSEQHVDAVFSVRFNTAFSQLSAQVFIEHVLHRDIGAAHIVTGYNFAFGKGRSGTTALLQEAAHALGIGFTACAPVVTAQGDAISSSAIRGALSLGDVRKAALLLGRAYAIEGLVRHGEKRGRTIGFPTANIALTHLFQPRYGVYAARVTLPDGEADYPAVVNIGVRPTVGSSQPLMEVHLLDAHEDLYGKRLRVCLVAFIRGEQRFDGLESLQKQITKDVQCARDVLAG